MAGGGERGYRHMYVLRPGPAGDAVTLWGDLSGAGNYMTGTAGK